MPKITYVQHSGKQKEVDVPVGTSLMLGAIKANVGGIDAECGGCLSCATCHVYVDPDFFEKIPSMEEEENEMLTGVSSERQSNSRLSCQVKVTRMLDGMTVNIPETQS